ncbi:hypothetical protein PoB_007058600 [Plakobranchus ocellatus]|uniref:Uncharacterized protein n=1 Tax=Plakobranchus ocellatus TaxID=259542 RepID=A0AAV4DIV0_9GAST|nr:hypothetical protein PoB_007058600 [Plakobranchus ocellatus]
MTTLIILGFGWESMSARITSEAKPCVEASLAVLTGIEPVSGTLAFLACLRCCVAAVQSISKDLVSFWTTVDGFRFYRIISTMTTSNIAFNKIY